MRLKLLSSFLLFFAFLFKAFPHTGKDTLIVKDVSKPEKTSFYQLDELDSKFPMSEKDFRIASEPEFTFENIKNEYKTEPSIESLRTEALAKFEEIDKEGKWVETLSNEDVNTLPVGVKHDLNGVEYAIGIIKAKINPQYTELTVFARIILPQTDEKGKPVELFFGADNVKFSHQGGIIGDANLVLLGDVFIPFNGGSWLLSLKGAFDYKTGNTTDKSNAATYVTISCDGVEELALNGEVQFSRNMLLPVNAKGDLLPDTRPYQNEEGATIQIPNRVRGSFSVVASDWNDMIVDLSITPFVMADHPDKFMFGVNKAVFDFSDLRTEGVKFPKYYRDHNLLQPSVESWRGVYVQSLDVALPKEFKTEESIAQNKRVSFKAMDMIIDGYGISGKFSANNIIPIKEGRTSAQDSWAFSVDTLGLELAANKFVGAKFSGELVLPIGDNTDKIKNENEEKSGSYGLMYRGIISEEEYLMLVSTKEEIEINIWRAKAELLPNSSVELRAKEGNFYPKAILNGRMSISASQKSIENQESNKEGDETVEFKGIEFQNLVLQTESPAIRADYFGYKGEMKLANFPVSISDIAFKSTGASAGLEFNLRINLMGSDDKGFAGETRLGIYGKLDNETRKQKWKYERLDMHEIALDADIGAIQLKGSLILMDDHPIYGDGFSAELEGTFAKFGPIKCKTIFGKKDFRYWYVDGAIEGLKLQMGPFQISGFAGGAYYKMTRRPDAGPDFSPSGLSYIPEEKTGLGMKAMVMGAIADESTIAVKAGFEIEFNRSGGVNRLGFYGEGQVMKAFDFPNPVANMTEKLSAMVNNEMVKGVMDTKVGKSFLDKATEEYEPEIVGEGVITAKVAIEFDFVNESFHSTLDVYVNVGSVITGRASKGRAGWGVAHIDPDQWYVYMGTPDDRLGLKFSLGPLSMETGGYFMIGDNLPGSPPPPPIVADILGVEAESLNYMRDENALASGKGFAFGHDFSVDTGDLRFLMFYARFQAGGGFDIMLKDYGDAECSNTGDEVGFNGWYANGQAYAYLQGELGIRIKIFFKKKKISIIRGGAAVLLQVKAPNPIWMRGYVGGHYNLLGGLVSGRFRFKLTLGEECEFVDDTPLGGIKVIASITPKEDENDVDVFATPQATFTMKVNESFIIPEDEGDMTYKVLLEKFSVIDPEGREIDGVLEWNYGNDRATFISKDILPPDTQLKLYVEVSFQKQIEGVFRTIEVDGKKALEIKEHSFTTGGAPNVIPLQNIEYAYPVLEQKYFYTDEYKNGYIQLRRGQDYLFDDAYWKSQVKIVDATGSQKLSSMNYNSSDNKVYYTFPDLNRNQNYVLQIVSMPKNAGSNDSDGNLTTTEVQQLDNDNTMEITTNLAENLSKEGEIERLTYNFSSSEYKTFADKIKDIKVTDDQWGKISSDVIYLTSSTKTYEGFGFVEMAGSVYTQNKPLINAEATLDDKYFQIDIDPMIYQKYPAGTSYTLSRDINEWGFRPVKSLPLRTNYMTSAEYGVNLETLKTQFPFRYNLPYAYKTDHMDIRNKVLNAYVNGIIQSDSSYLDILESEYLFIRNGNYSIKLSYVLPGGIKGSSAKYEYKNPIKIR